MPTSVGMTMESVGQSREFGLTAFGSVAPKKGFYCIYLLLVQPSQSYSARVDDMRNPISAILSALVASTIATANPAGAQTVAACPAAGTAVAVTSSRGTYTVKHFGPDTSDPSICLADVEGQGALFPGQRRTLYVWYDLTNFSMTNASVEGARNALGGILSGQKNDAAFDVVMTRAEKSWSWSSTESWQRVGQDTIKVGTQSIAATHLRYETKPRGGTNYHVVWDLLYDPVRHLLLKGHATVMSGTPAVTDFEVTAISAP